MPKVVVVGAGISGLSCAYFLRRRLPGLELLVLEAGSRPGGLVESFRENGFVVEAGAHGFLNAHPSTLDLARDLGLAAELLAADGSARRRYIYVDGELRPFPTSARALWTSNLLSSPGKMRLLWEPLHKRGLPDHDVAIGPFLRERLGHEAVDRLIDPLIAGINGGDVDRLSFSATLPKLASLAGRGESLLRSPLFSMGRASKPVSDGEFPRGQLLSFRGGTARLGERLAEELRGQIRYETPVKRIARERGRWSLTAHSGAGISCDAVVLALPAPTASMILRSSRDSGAARAARVLSEVEHSPVAVVALGYARSDVAHSLDGFGYLVPSSEGGPVLGVLWASSMFPGVRCAEGQVLIEAICGGPRFALTGVSDDTLLDCVAEQVGSVLGIDGKPSYTRVVRHRTGLPQYTVGHGARLAALDVALAAAPGLHVTGSSLRGIGINACTRDASRVAARLEKQLERDYASPRARA